MQQVTWQGQTQAARAMKEGPHLRHALELHGLRLHGLQRLHEAGVHHADVHVSGDLPPLEGGAELEGLQADRVRDRAEAAHRRRGTGHAQGGLHVLQGTRACGDENGIA